MPNTFDWKIKYADKITNAAKAMRLVQSGDSVFIGSGCGQPQYLVNALVEYCEEVRDVRIMHILTMGQAPYLDPRYRDRFSLNTFFIGDNVRATIEKGIGDYTPIFLSEIPNEFESGRIPIDVALVSVSPPDSGGLCSLGVSVDVVKAAVANAKYVIAQVNANMPRTYGDSFIHVNDFEALVPYDEDLIEIPRAEVDDVMRRIGQNVARLIEDGSTIECGIGRVPQVVAECLRDKKDLGVHTEMFGDWIIDLVDCGAITCAKKNLNRGKVVASFCMGSKRLYDYLNNNHFFEFYPTEYVNDVNIIAQHEKMVAINVGLEVDLTGQVCADSLGYKFYSGIGGQVDFIRGAARSRGGKAIIVVPSTAKGGTISRIVPHLAEGAGVVVTRGDVHYVVSEYGVAYLHGKSIRERVLSLINIAHPKFRAELIEAAKKQHYLYQDQIALDTEQIIYPEELEIYQTLNDGTELFFRPVKPTDEASLSEMLYSLSPTSLRTRYMTHTVTFPHKDVQQLTNVDYINNLAIVGTVPGVSGEEIVAIAQYFLDPKTQAAEVAFIVQDEWQQKGMGTVLLQYLCRVAKQRGIKKFFAKVLPTNKAMLTVFYNSGYKVNTEFDGDVYNIEFSLAPAKVKTGDLAK
jgi:acyl-CoA hydrolase/RimJ/RimL family protein N-acetyltransferase